ncbi:hypothetical protein H2201_000394 [Coniosporium apollinis]|uniref:BZIP domain-containing protein n=1 Tax=Coniosporium apollinis TaxID=61459 RepID=A0ABQ9P4K0_9PEZI|nr:hypothetical protein H2201_000394 [Coniosporium apollinis]
MTTDSNTAKNNLTRIRDNQRRSRARRKEYLQELEAKYRNCEQIGAEASAEIQTAARRVLEENKRLRALLRQKGVSEDEIDTFTEEGLDNPQCPPVGVSLDLMLGRRRPCPGDARCGTELPNPSPNPTLPVPPVPAVSQHQARMLSSAVEPRPAPLLHHTSSSSIESSSVATPAQDALYPPAIGNYTLPRTTANVAYTVDTYHPPSNQYGAPINGLWPDLVIPITPDVDYGSTSSCVYAANIIRSMRSEVGIELEVDLGCNPAGTDCEVNNVTVFDVMDKYSAQRMSS